MPAWFNHFTIPGIERVQALADISRWALCCQLRNPCTDCKSAQSCTTRAFPHTIASSYIRVRAVLWEYGEGQTDTQTHRRPWSIYISPRLRLTRNGI